jgi:hypothetical protein
MNERMNDVDNLVLLGFMILIYYIIQHILNLGSGLTKRTEVVVFFLKMRYDLRIHAIIRIQ